MTVGVFLDKDHQPTPREISAALGARKVLWKSILQYLDANYRIPVQINFGGKNYGWNYWYRKGGKTLVNLFPQGGFFVAQVVLGGEQVKQALRLKLGKSVGTVLREATQFHDGRWLYIPVKTKKDLKNVILLMQVKRKPAVR
jgi:hypothetical protein